MTPHRREEDRNVVKRVWDLATPWVQVIGFIILCGFVGGTKFNQFEALGATMQLHEQRISVLESNSDKINQKLDDLINFWHVPQHNR